MPGPTRESSLRGAALSVAGDQNSVTGADGNHYLDDMAAREVIAHR